jgi:bifunctional DNA-binding transcriptional regulator/antitoxin component of YhaV-PrlF toxin-antitoxin module
MITRMTGKNQVTVPAEIAGKAGLRNGSRLDWRLTERADVLEVHLLPDLPSLAAGLRGRGKMFKKLSGSPVDRLHQERQREEREREGK